MKTRDRALSSKWIIFGCFFFLVPDTKYLMMEDRKFCLEIEEYLWNNISISLFMSFLLLHSFYTKTYICI